MQEPFECLVCGEPLDREIGGAPIRDGLIRLWGRLVCPRGHTETVEYPKLLEQWRAQRGV